MSASTPVKLSFGNTPTAPVATSAVRPILEDVRRAGFEGILIDKVSGAIHLEIKWPGLSTMAFTLDDLETFAARLVQADPPADSPAAIFARTASVDDSGNLEGRFSYGKKSRALTVPIMTVTFATKH